MALVRSLDPDLPLLWDTAGTRRTTSQFTFQWFVDWREVELSGGPATGGPERYLVTSRPVPGAEVVGRTPEGVPVLLIGRSGEA
jgi:hypothetical protein